MCDLFGFFLGLIASFSCSYIFVVMFYIIRSDIQDIKRGGMQKHRPIRLDKVKKKKKKNKKMKCKEYDFRQQFKIKRK